MRNDMDIVAFPIARLALAYLLHSTLLLGGTWLFLRGARVRSWALRERIWKLAVILPLITAAIPLPASWSRSTARPGFEPLALRLPRTELDVARVEEPQKRPINAVDFSAEPAESLEMDKAARAEEPIVASAGKGQFPVASSAPLPKEASRLEAEPTGVQRSAAVAKVICYTVLAFFILGTLHVVRRSFVFARSLRNCRPIRDKSICNVLDELLRQANVRRRVRLLESAADRPPAAFGLFRWTIVVPQALIPTLQPDELRALLAHEVAHLARGDALWLWIGRILCSCCAFQPLNFFARRQLRVAAEFLCDEWAVRNSASRFALARCLTRVAEWTAHFAPQPIELAAVGPRSNLSERVERLVLERSRGDSWDSNRCRWLVWAAAIAVTFCLEYSAPRTILLAEPPSHAANASNDSESKPILADALNSLSTETGDLLSDLRRVDTMLKEASPTDPAIEALAVRLRAQAAALAKSQTRLASFGSRASVAAQTTNESRVVSRPQE
jgi:beta-lactamase regulating signal transducer with metallopeptidase domain